MIGDSGYGCKRYLVTPFRNPINRAQLRYNKAISSTRSIIEQAFGRWKRRFPCLAISIKYLLVLLFLNLIFYFFRVATGHQKCFNNNSGNSCSS